MDCDIKLYRFQHVGYYEPYKSTPLFGSPGDIFNSFLSWQKELEINSTATADSPEDTGHMPTYVFGAEQSAYGGACLVLWNGIAPDSSSNNLLAIAGGAKTGGSSVSSHKFTPGQIPGFPSYYWVDTDNGLLGTLKLGHTSGRVGAFERCLLNYMSLHHSCVQSEHYAPGKFRVNGYLSPDGLMWELNKLKPRCDLRVIRQLGQLDYLRMNRKKITKVIRKENLNIDREEDRPLISALFKTFGRSTDSDFAEAHSKGIRFKSELSICPTAKELEEMIDTALRWLDTKKRENWENIGLKLQGETKPRMLAKVIAEVTVDVNVLHDSQGVYHADALTHGLAVHRDYFAKIKESEDAQMTKTPSAVKKVS